jgi:hypothetical protein
VNEQYPNWMGDGDPHHDSPDVREYAAQQARSRPESTRAEPPRSGPKARWPDPVPISALTGEAAKVDWLWHGCIVRRHTTLFTALMKGGKTTFVSHLLRALQDGASFCGRVTTRCRTLVISEESQAIWAQRRDALGLDDSLETMCRPMMGKPTFAEWADFLLHVRGCATDRAVDIIAFDTVAAFTPWRNENDSAEVMTAVTPLNLLTEAGFAVVLFHHSGKADQTEGRAARGSTALTGAVDIILEMRRYRPDEATDRRRVLSGLGRFDEVPDEMVVELSDDGTSYTACGDKKAVAARELRDAILAVLPTEAPGLTASDVHADMPEDTRPRRGDVGKALLLGADRDWICAGSGKRGDPYRFWRRDS